MGAELAYVPWAGTIHLDVPSLQMFLVLAAVVAASEVATLGCVPGFENNLADPSAVELASTNGEGALDAVADTKIDTIAVHSLLAPDFHGTHCCYPLPCHRTSSLENSAAVETA